MNKKEIRHYLVNNYSNLGKIGMIKPMRHDNINSLNFLVHISNRRFVLREFVDGSSPLKIEKICQILNFCVKNGAKVPQPIKHKKNYYVDKKKNIFLTKFYSGRTFSGNQNELVDLAKHLALLHKALSKNRIPFRDNIKPLYKTLEEAELKKIIGLIKKQPSKDANDKLILSNIDFLNELIWNDLHVTKDLYKRNFRKQLIHSDLHTKNVIFNGKKVSVILDFNSIRNGYKIEDIAFTSFRFASLNSRKLSVIKNKIQKFVDTYRYYNDINENQYEHFSEYLRHILLGRINYILRKRYFENSNLWIKVLKKHINSLKLIQLLEN